MIHTRCSFTFVFGHSFNSKSFCCKRAYKKILKGFNLVPSSFLCCFDDTSLEPTNRFMAFGPVDGGPCQCSAGKCTYDRICHVFCFLSKRLSNDLVIRDLREVCSLSGKRMFHSLSLSLQQGVRFLPYPLPASSLASFTVCFPKTGRIQAYHV